MTLALDMDFEVRRDDENDHADIRVRLLDLFPLKAFDHHATNLTLSWILTNKDAKKSYISICKNFRKEKVLKGNQQSWNFSFEPPPMAKWKLHVRGRHSSDRKSYLIEEIIGVDIHSDMPKTVTIRHQEFIQKTPGSGVISTPGSSSSWTQTDSNFEIDDDSASDQSETVIINVDRSFVRFLKPCRVRKELIKSSSPTVIPGGTQEGGESRRRFSTGEPHSMGSLPAASVGGRQDDSDPELECSTRFSGFNEMLKILCDEHGCTIVKSNSFRLNAVGRSRIQFLSDGTPRVIKAVVIKRDQVESILIEIDTSDTSTLAATKLIYFPESSRWEREFLNIRAGVVRNNLTWPAQLFDNYYGKSGHTSIPHPKHNGSEIGNIPVDAMDGWARRVLKRLP